MPIVFDVVYDPWPTPLGAAALEDRRTLVGGLDLLLWQAVDQVRAMTGRFDVPVAAMRAAGEAGLAERRSEAPAATSVQAVDSTVLAVVVAPCWPGWVGSRCRP